MVSVGTPVVRWFHKREFEWPGPALCTLVRIIARFGTADGPISGGESHGTGFLFDSQYSTLLTARHVVAPPSGLMLDEVEVRWLCADGTVLQTWARAAAYLGGNKSPDLALVYLSNPIGPVRFGPTQNLTDSLPQGASVAARLYGFPLMEDQSLLPPTSISLEATPTPSGWRLSLPGQPGMSGGPLASNGDLLGIYRGVIQGRSNAAHVPFEALTALFQKVEEGPP